MDTLGRVRRESLPQLDETAPTTRDEVTSRAAADWLIERPEHRLTEADLAKTVRQLLTEVFQTGRQRAGAALSEYAEGLLALAGADRASFAAARVYTTSAEMPAETAAVFGVLAELLCPLGAAIQLARIPVTDAAVRAQGCGRAAATIDRRVLRGFVVSQIRPRALQIHSRVGAGESAGTYLRLILEDSDALAEAVLAAANVKQARPTVLSVSGAQRLAEFAQTWLPELAASAARYGADADEILGDAMLKLAAAFRNRPDLDIDIRYAQRTLGNAANSFYHLAAQRRAAEVCGDDALSTVAVVDEDEIEVADLVLRRVLDAARELKTATGRDEALAGESLLHYFLTDPQITDVRKARLGGHVLALAAPSARNRADEVAAGLRGVAERLAGGSNTNPRRVCALALAALRAA